MTRTLLRLLLVALVAALAGSCATPDETWIHPDTGTVPPRSGPDGG